MSLQSHSRITLLSEWIRYTPKAAELMVLMILEWLILRFLKNRNAKIAVMIAKIEFESDTNLYQEILPEWSNLHAPNKTVAQEHATEAVNVNVQNFLLLKISSGHKRM